MVPRVENRVKATTEYWAPSNGDPDLNQTLKRIRKAQEKIYMQRMSYGRQRTHNSSFR